MRFLLFYAYPGPFLSHASPKWIAVMAWEKALQDLGNFFLLTSVIAYRYFGSPESGDRFCITHGRQHVNDKQIQLVNAS